MKLMNMLWTGFRRLLLTLGALALAVILFGALSIGRSKPQPPLSPERERDFLEAQIVGHALILFARGNHNKRPNSLDQLIPAYIGSTIDLSKLVLHLPGEDIGGEHVVIAANPTPGPEGKMILINGEGKAYLLRPGD